MDPGNQQPNIEQLYVEWKPLLFALAYHALGRAMDAEDIVQEVFLSLQSTPPQHVDNWKAYLCRAVHNRCLNRLQSAGHRREVYTGPWLPEPVATEGITSDNPLERYMLKESLSTACQLLLQQLSATERAVFVLREVFQFPFEDIAGITGKSSNNCRQIFYRAKRSLGDLPEARPGQDGQQAAIVEPFLQALVTGNINRLMSLLSADAVLYTDGGGKVKAALRPIHGAERIVRFFDGIRSEVPADFAFELREVNGGPGVVFLSGGYVFAVLTLQLDSDRRIADLFVAMNPDKLGHLNR